MRILHPKGNSTLYTVNPMLSVIIVNYNVKFYLEQCLESVRRASQGLQVEVFVVDN